MKIKILPFLIFLFCLLVFIIFYKGLKNPNIYTPKINLNEEIPIFVTSLLEKNIKVSEDEIFKGDNFFILNIWSSWCVPCRDEHPFLINLSDIENLTLIGINYKDKKRNAKNFLAELTNPYDLILLDEDGTLSIEWGAFGVPETFLIYKKKIIKKLIGPINNKTFDEIKSLIK